jgi:hypothetical protein
MVPSMSYATLLQELAAQIPTAPLNLVLIDGVPACGKSSLAAALQQHLLASGRNAVVVGNDWFMDARIRKSGEILRGLALGMSGRPVEEVERELLARFLDGQRLRHFQESLLQAEKALADGKRVSLSPQGAHWNLARAPAWNERHYSLEPGTVVIVEGTLSRAVYLPLFPQALCVFVEVPLAEARQRFLRRNQQPDTRRNLAFSLLAWAGPAYRLAAEMIGRDRCHLRVDGGDWAAPRLIKSPAS